MGKTFWLVVLLLSASMLFAQASLRDSLLQKEFSGDAVSRTMVNNVEVAVVKLSNLRTLTYSAEEYNKLGIFFLAPNGVWLNDQKSAILFEGGVGTIFTQGGYAFFYSPEQDLLISDARGSSKEFINAFSMKANNPNLQGQTGYAIWGIVFSKYKQFFADRGISMSDARNTFVYVQETIENILGGKGDLAVLNDDGSIKDNSANKIAIFYNDNRVGTFITSGQLDPATNKYYNQAMTPDGNIYVGQGMDLVTVKTLLTDAKYKDLALAILNNKTLTVEPVVREEGKRLLQSGQLNGVSDDIRKYLDNKTSDIKTRRV